MTPILTTSEIEREAAALARAGETLPVQLARLRSERIEAKAAARAAIAARIAGDRGAVLSAEARGMNSTGRGTTTC